MDGRCSICKLRFDPSEISAIQCGHTFHRECIEQSSQTTKKCPLCRAPFASIIQQLYFDIDSVEDGTDQSPEKVYAAALKEVRTLEKQLHEALKWKMVCAKEYAEIKRLRAANGRRVRELASMRRLLEGFDAVMDRSEELLAMCESMKEQMKELEEIHLEYAMLAKPKSAKGKPKSPKRSVSLAPGPQSSNVAPFRYGLSAKSRKCKNTETETRDVEKAMDRLASEISRLRRERMKFYFWDPKKPRPMPSRLRQNAPAITMVTVDNDEERSSGTDITTDESREQSTEGSETEE